MAKPLEIYYPPPVQPVSMNRCIVCKQQWFSELTTDTCDRIPLVWNKKFKRVLCAACTLDVVERNIEGRLG